MHISSWRRFAVFVLLPLLAVLLLDELLLSDLALLHYWLEEPNYTI